MRNSDNSIATSHVLLRPSPNGWNISIITHRFPVARLYAFRYLVRLLSALPISGIRVQKVPCMCTVKSRLHYYARHILTVFSPTNFLQSRRQNVQSKMITF